MKKKVMLAVGGTGGHIFPAIALAEKLKMSGVEVCFAGSLQAIAPFSSFEIPAETLSSRNPKKLLRGFLTITKGIKKAKQAIKTFSPDLVIGFGSFYSLPTLIAAKLMKCPVVLHEQNSIPGRVNKLLSPFAKLTCVQFDHALKHLKGKSTLVKMLVRPELEKRKGNKKEAYDYFNLSPQKKTLLIFGGSQGAKGINDHFEKAQNNLSKFQFLHFTGKGNEVTYTGCRACVRPFEKRMDLAWSIADLVIARAGAGTVSEHFSFSVPALFIPYPYAMDGHQEANADFAVFVGGARKIKQSELTKELLTQVIHEMMDDATHQSMIQALHQFSLTQKDPSFDSVVKEVLNV